MRVAALMLVLAGPAAAEELPDFATCMDREMARFERTLDGIRGAGVSFFEVTDVRGVGYCGSVGIVLCDRSRDPFGCQRALRIEQDLLRQRVLASLPQPESIAAEGEAAAFYPRVWALAQGQSAGPDCAGDLPVRQVWCEAWQANNRLRDAVLAWQVARVLGAVGPAVAEGWARAPTPARPRARGAP